MRKSVESDIRESLALSKLINRDIKGGGDREGVDQAMLVLRM